MVRRHATCPVPVISKNAGTIVGFTGRCSRGQLDARWNGGQVAIERLAPEEDARTRCRDGRMVRMIGRNNTGEASDAA
jgi:hypothetical protein